MTAAERLLALSKTTGAAGALLLLIGSGATAGAALLDYSGLESATAAEHLLYEKVVEDSVSGGLLKVHRERVAKVQRYQKLLAAQKKAIEEKPVEAPVEVPALLKPPEQLVINETALRYTQDALYLTGETQADALIKREKFDISPELVQKLAEIRQVAIEQVEIPEIAPEHLALIRNNDDALAMILIYWGFEDEA